MKIQRNSQKSLAGIFEKKKIIVKKTAERLSLRNLELIPRATSVRITRETLGKFFGRIPGRITARMTGKISEKSNWRSLLVKFPEKLTEQFLE